MMFLCTVVVAFTSVTGHVSMGTRALHGSPVGYSYTNYIMDFSKDTTLVNYIGDYSSMQVPKKDCILLSK